MLTGGMSVVHVAKNKKKEADQVMKTVKLTGFWPKCCSSVSKVTLIIHYI